MQRPEIADFTLARVGGLPVEAAGRLVLAATARLVETALAMESELQAAAPRVEEILYRLVPGTSGETERRRSILRFKRNVHNLRPWAEAADDLRCAVGACADGDDAAVLGRWVDLLKARQAVLAEAASTYDREVEAAGHSLADSLRDPELRRALALASPSLLADLLRKDDDCIPGSKRARSGLGYVARAALKTSPFSSLTTVSVSRFGGGLETQRPARMVRLANTISYSLAQTVARNPELAQGLGFEPNRGLQRAGDGAFALPKIEYGGADSFAWRTENWVKLRLDPARVPNLVGLLANPRTVGYSQLVELLAADGFAQPHAALVDLMNRSLLRPVVPPFAKLADAVRPHGGEALASAIEGLQRLVEAYAEASGPERLDLTLSMRQCIRRAFDACGASAPEWLDQASLVFEDVTCGDAEALPTSVREDLAQLAESLRPRIFRAKIYDYLYRHFVSRHGETGEVRDIVSFIREFMDRPEGGELWGRALAEDRMAMNVGHSMRTAVPSGDSASPPALTIFFQVVAESREALERGDYRIVLNQVAPGQGGLVGRFAPLFGNGLTALLEGWIDQLYAGRPVLEMPVMGEWNNLQAPQGLAGDTLRWYAEGSAPDRAGVDIGSLSLSVDTDSRTFVIRDPGGRTIAPAYLGTVPIPLAGGQYLRLFLRMVDPWLVDPEVGRTTGMGRDEESLEPVRHFPREESGRVVTRRACWRVDSAALPRRGQAQTPLAYMVELDRWRRANGIPDEVFVTIERAKLNTEHKARKPVWLHFASPHTLELLWSLAGSDARAFIMTEALPAQGQHWAGRVTEFAALAGWPEHRRAAPADEWLYLRVYPGSMERLDELCRRELAAAVEVARRTARMDRWFFIRYIDSRGPHLRLRLRVRRQDRDALAAELARHFADCHMETATYEPEYEKYGTGAEMLAAERNFEVSSESALDAWRDESKAREGVALAHMRDMVWRVFPDAHTRGQFLRNYARYWSQGRNVLPTPVRPASGTPLDGLVVDPETCFDFLHMHNNRLGIPPGDEASLAFALLAGAAVATASPSV